MILFTVIKREASLLLMLFIVNRKEASLLMMLMIVIGVETTLIVVRLHYNRNTVNVACSLDWV